MPKPIAVQNCEARNLDFVRGFRYQYVVAPEQLNVPGFHVERFGDHWVHAGKDLRCTLLKDGNGQVFGIVLGLAVDHHGQTPEDAITRVVPDASASAAMEQFERYLEILAGRYAIVIRLSGTTWFYCDPVGMIGAVSARETRRIASSPGLCINRPYVPPALYDQDALSEGRGTYGFNHTCDRHVFRHNASHRLNLDQFSSARFWPRAERSFEAAENDYGAIYDEIICATQNIVEGITELGDTSLALSGGNDSRMILALTRPETRRSITQVFSHISNYANRRDSELAKAQCAATGIDHQAHDKKAISIPKYKRLPEVRLFKEASTVPGPAPTEHRNGLSHCVLENSIVLRGHQCNILRGQYLTSPDPDDWAKPAWQIRMMRLVGNGEFNAEVAERFTPDFMAYYRDLPQNALTRSADFIFFETLVPAALGPLFSGQSNAFFLSPFNSRRLVQLFMQPDTKYRLSNATTHDLILRADPVLFSLPYGYELPADMKDTEETLEKRRKRCAETAKRYKKLYGNDAPSFEVVPFGS